MPILVSFAGGSTARALALGLALLVEPQGVEIPAPRGFVNDFAEVIPEENEERIQRIIVDVRAKSGGDIAVVTLPRLGGRTIEEVATRILRQWGVGSAGRPGDPRRNVGVVILLVPKETSGEPRSHGRIETGSGAEGFVTDAATGAILDEGAPLFRAGQYGPALELATQRVAELFAREFGFTQDTAARVAPPTDLPSRAPARRTGVPWILIVLVIFLVFSMLSGGARRRRRRRSGCGGCLPIFIPMGGGWGGGGWSGGRSGWGGRGWGGGGFGGGFGGGGFGGFGGFGGGGGGFGGGASRSW